MKIVIRTKVVQESKSIGEVFLYLKKDTEGKEIHLKAVTVQPRKHACTECYFKVKKVNCEFKQVECRGVRRPDGKNVYFEQVNPKNYEL